MISIAPADGSCYRLREINKCWSGFNGLVLPSFLSQAKDSEGQEQAQPKL